MFSRPKKFNRYTTIRWPESLWWPSSQDIPKSLAIFKPKTKINYKISNIKNLEKITNIFFSNRRKMINKPLSKIFKKHVSVAEKLKIKLHLRPSELSNDDYYKLTEYYEKIN